MSNVLDRIKETWAEEQVESSFDDWKYVSEILKDHFLSQVEDKNKKEFIEYLEELNYDEDFINNMFKRRWMMKKYKVYTKWIGYSEIDVKAKSEEEAKEMVNTGNYDPSDEIHTGNGLEYGYEGEEITEIKEVNDEIR